MTHQLTSSAPGVERVGRLPGDRRALVAVVLACVLLRVAMGARTSWAFDDFQARERLSGPLSPTALFTEHNGHVNPIGTLIQWLVQHGFPGHYVPLMVISAVLVGFAAFLIGLWAQDIYGPGWVPVLAAGFLGLSPMLIELATWWSVAVYAAPMLAASSALVWVATRALRTERGWAPVLGVYGLCLFTFPKAVLLPILLITIAATCPLVGAPVGFKTAIRRWRPLWLRMMAITGAYSLFYLVVAREQGVPSRTVGTIISWMAAQTGQATLPALWGGPWQWIGRFGLFPVPLPVVLTVAALTVAAIAWTSVRVPSSRPMWVGWSAYLLISVLMTALARAGLSLAGPSLRYAFDMALPSAVAVTVVIGAWPARTRRRSRLWPALALAVWLLSAAVSYVHAWPKPLPITHWSREVKTHFPQFPDGLLEQPMPSAFVLLPERLGTYLTGEPGAPAEVGVVVGEFFGFDERGSVVTNAVVGTPSVVPTTICGYRTTGGTITVPLAEPLASGRHTVQVDYSLDAASTVHLDFGAATTRGEAPAGDHRLFAVVEGDGQELSVRVSNPVATLCVHAVVAGWPVAPEQPSE